MTDTPTPRPAAKRRRRYPAATSRIAIAGLSTTATFAIVAALGRAGAVSVTAPQVVAEPVTTPVTAAPTTTPPPVVVVRRVPVYVPVQPSAPVTQPRVVVRSTGASRSYQPRYQAPRPAAPVTRTPVRSAPVARSAAS